MGDQLKVCHTVRSRFSRFALFAAVAANTLILPIAFAADANRAETGSTIESPVRPALRANDDTIELANLQEHFQQVAERAARSVVAISAAVAPVDADDALRADDLNVQRLDAILDRATRTVGTGFVIDADGFILTNEHVIAGAQQLWITTDDDKVYPAIVVGSDPRADLAVLKIPAEKLTPVTFAAMGSVRRGDWTIALGNPYGLAALGEMSMSVGVVSAIDRSLTRLSNKENRLYSNLIQTTAQINPGNSGGPLFNLAGEVIGLNTAVVLPQKQTNGIGFAMPITGELMTKVRQLKEGREVVYGYMGVMVNNPTPRQRRDARVTTGGGVLVESIEQDSPASATSLKVGDMVLSIGPTDVRDSDHFVRVVGDTPVDCVTSVRIVRGSKQLTLDFTLRRRPMPSVAVTQELQRLRWRGLVLGPIPANWNPPNSKPAPATGVMVVGVDSNSPLAKDGISSGTVITAIGGKPVNDLISLQRVINETPIDQCRLTLAPRADNVASVNVP